MKRIIFLATMIIGFSAFSQEKPKISSAVIAIDQHNDVKEAKKHIDAAEAIINEKNLSDISTKTLGKFYFYKGKINFRISISEDPEVIALDDKALDHALEGFMSLLEFEKNGKQRYTKDAKDQLGQLTNGIAQRGIDASVEKNYSGAYTDFITTFNIKKDILGSLDTGFYYNAALMAQKGEMYPEAIGILEELIALEYKGVLFQAVNIESGDTAIFASGPQMKRMVELGQFNNPMVTGDIRADLYLSLIYLALANEDTALYKSGLQEGRVKFPGNVDLLKAELQLFFDNEEYDKALDNLDQAIAAQPENVMMYYNKGVILQTEMNRTAAALEAYKQALEIDPVYSDALYMSSIIYIDSANAIGKAMNDLPLNAKTKYKALEKQQIEVFTIALPYLEKAREINPDDEQGRSALIQVYRALKMYDKAKVLMDEQK